MNQSTTTLTANLTHDPELRFAGNGNPVANLRFAHTPRVFNRDTGKWEDQETIFFSGSVWNQHGENVAESLARGSQVLLVGSFRNRTYTTAAGEERTVLEMQIEEIAVPLRFATVKVAKASRVNRETGEVTTPGEFDAAQEHLRKLLGAEPVGADAPPF